MVKMHNYHWDESDPAKPYTHKSPCNPLAHPPENATRIAPEKYSGDVIPCWNGKRWVLKFDWRKVKLYDKQTAKRVHYGTVMADASDIEKHYTLIPPVTEFDRWINGKWVTDEAAKQQYLIDSLKTKRRRLIDEATRELGIIGDVIEYKKLNEGGESDITTYVHLHKSWGLYRGHLASMKFVTGNEDFPKPPLTHEEING